MVNLTELHRPIIFSTFYSPESAESGSIKSVISLPGIGLKSKQRGSWPSVTTMKCGSPNPWPEPFAPPFPLPVFFHRSPSPPGPSGVSSTLIFVRAPYYEFFHYSR